MIPSWQAPLSRFEEVSSMPQRHLPLFPAGVTYLTPPRALGSPAGPSDQGLLQNRVEVLILYPSAIVCLNA
jgi:hypothetical protein